LQNIKHESNIAVVAIQTESEIGHK